MSTSAVTPAIAAVTWPEGKEYSLSAYAPAACHQVRKGSTVSGRGRATKSLSQKFVMSAPQHTAPNMQMPALRVFGNSISAMPSARKTMPFSPSSVMARHSGVKAPPAVPAKLCSACKMA